VIVEVKICGLTRPEDAAAAARAGASYLGVVFAGGPRLVDTGRARAIVEAGDGVPVIGIFGEQSPDDIVRICAASGLSGAQLHGTYPRAAAARLREARLRVWRVVRIAVPEDLDLLPEAAAEAHAVLVEPSVAHAAGGSGISLPLAIAREARGRLAGRRMALAGGLTPETVGEAVALVRPDIVDVSSGVERQPGIKDPEKISRFLEAALGHSPTP
jgi:phosphoribosylanthranilate isomerase